MENEAAVLRDAAADAQAVYTFVGWMLVIGALVPRRGPAAQAQERVPLRPPLQGIMSRALRELERDLAATRQTRAAVAAGDVVDMEDPAVHATDDANLNRPTLFDDLARTEARDELAEEDARAAADAARHAAVKGDARRRGGAGRASRHVPPAR